MRGQKGTICERKGEKNVRKGDIREENINEVESINEIKERKGVEKKENKSIRKNRCEI